MAVDHGTGESYAMTVHADGRITRNDGATIDPFSLLPASDRPQPSFQHPDRTEAWV